MSNEKQLRILRRDVAEWNAWRARNMRRRIDLRAAELSDAQLAGADLHDADLKNAALKDCNLRGAKLNLVDLTEADLTGANLRGADLSRSILARTDVSGANLSGANLSRVKGVDDWDDFLRETSGDETTKLPTGVTAPVHWFAEEVSEPPKQEPFAPSAFVNDQGFLDQLPDQARADIPPDERAQLLKLVQQWTKDVIAVCKSSNAASHFDAENFAQLLEELSHEEGDVEMIYISGLFSGFRDELPLDELPEADRRLNNRLQKLEAALHNLGMTYEVYRAHWQRVQTEAQFVEPSMGDLDKVAATIGGDEAEGALAERSRSHLASFRDRLRALMEIQASPKEEKRGAILSFFGSIYNLWAHGTMVASKVGGYLGRVLHNEKEGFKSDPHGRIAVWVTLLTPLIVMIKSVLGLAG